MLHAPEEKGIMLIEYIILIAFFAIMATAAVKYLSLKVGTTFSTIASSMPG